MNRNDAKFLADKARSSKSFRDALDSLLKDFGVRQDIADSRLREVEQDNRATKEELSRCIRTLRTLENELKENAEHIQNLYKDIQVLQEKNKALEEEKKKREEADLVSSAREEEDKRNDNERNNRTATVTENAQAAASLTCACFCGASPNTQVIIEEEVVTTTTEKIPFSETVEKDNGRIRDGKGPLGSVNEISVGQKSAESNRTKKGDYIQSGVLDDKITRGKPRESDPEYYEEDSTRAHRTMTNNSNSFQQSSNKTLGNYSNDVRSAKTACDRGRKINRHTSSDSDETYFWDYSYSETGGPYDEVTAVIDETTFESPPSKTEGAAEFDTLTSDGDEKTEGPKSYVNGDLKFSERTEVEALFMNRVKQNEDIFHQEETRRKKAGNVCKMDAMSEHLSDATKNKKTQNNANKSMDENHARCNGGSEYVSFPDTLMKITSLSTTNVPTDQEKEMTEASRDCASPRSILRIESNTERRGAEASAGAADATVRFSPEIQTLSLNVSSPTSSSSCSSLSSPALSTPASSPPGSPSTSMTLSPSYPSSVPSTLSSMVASPSPISVSAMDHSSAADKSVSYEITHRLGSSLLVEKGKEDSTVVVVSSSPPESSGPSPVTSTVAPSSLNALTENTNMDQMKGTKTKELWCDLLENEGETNPTSICIRENERSDVASSSIPFTEEVNPLGTKSSKSGSTTVNTPESIADAHTNHHRKLSADDVQENARSKRSINNCLTKSRRGGTNAADTKPGNVHSLPVISPVSSPSKSEQTNENRRPENKRPSLTSDTFSGGKLKSENTKDDQVDVRITEEQVNIKIPKESTVENSKEKSMKTTQEKRTSKDNRDGVQEGKNTSDMTKERRHSSGSGLESSREHPITSKEDIHHPQTSVKTKAPVRMSDPGKSTEEKEMGMCANCSDIASQKCAMCHQVFYCKRECQKKHWKTHREQCQPFKVEENSELGRFMVASRNIKAGEVILIEDPIIVGPKQITEPICLGCYKRVDGSYSCSKCSWPLCGVECEQSPDHKPECVVGVEIGSPIQITNFEDTNHFYEIIAPLRCLALKKRSPKKYEQLMALESHYEDRKGSHIYKENQIRVVGMLRNYFMLLEFDPDVIDCSEYTIHKIMGILDVNALEIRQTDSEIQGLYPRFAMLEHSCIPNTKHKFGENKKVEVRAAMDIAKGDHLSTMYTHILWGTTARRDHLKHNKYFMCQCRRCSDPTELGTYFSGLRCTRCPEAYMVSAAPLDLLASWICTSCDYTLTADEVTDFNLKLGEEVERCLAQPSVQDLEKLIAEKYKIVHPNHFHLFACKHTLLQMYGRDKTSPEDANFGEPMDAEVNKRKEQLCQAFLKMCMTLDPGMSRLAPYVGVTLYEYHLAMIAKARRALALDPVSNKNQAKKELENARALLQQCMTVLKDEPEDQPEGALFKVAQGNLEELSAWALSLA